MKEFKPSAHFVSRVMEEVHTYEAMRQRRAGLTESLLVSRPLRWVMSAGSVFCWLLLSPTVCI